MTDADWAAEAYRQHRRGRRLVRAVLHVLTVACSIGFVFAVMLIAGTVYTLRPTTPVQTLQTGYNLVVVCIWVAGGCAVVGVPAAAGREVLRRKDERGA